MKATFCRPSFLQYYDDRNLLLFHQPFGLHQGLGWISLRVRFDEFDHPTIDSPRLVDLIENKLTGILLGDPNVGCWPRQGKKPSHLDGLCCHPGAHQKKPSRSQ